MMIGEIIIEISFLTWFQGNSVKKIDGCSKYFCDLSKYKEYVLVMLRWEILLLKVSVDT